MANVDELMAELLLPEDANNHSYSHLKSSFSSTSSCIVNNITYTDNQIPNSETIPAINKKNEHNSMNSTNYLTTTNNKTHQQMLIAPKPIYPQQNPKASYSSPTINPMNNNNYQHFTMK